MMSASEPIPLPDHDDVLVEEVKPHLDLEDASREEIQSYFKERWSESFVPPSEEDVKEMMAAGIRPWEPYVVIDIQFFGTNKTTYEDHEGKEYGRRQVDDGNCLDVVRGCRGGATNRDRVANRGYGCPWGCYSKESSRRFHRIFNIPVSMRLDENLLRSGLADLDGSWVRIGVNGDPSFDWDLLVMVCAVIASAGKTPVVLTRFWRVPQTDHLLQLASFGTVLHGSLCALDSPMMRDRIVTQLDTYHDLGGNDVLRLVTFKFQEDDPLWKIQDELARRASTLEQPARLQTTNPSWSLVDQSAYHPYVAMTSGQENKRWKTAGPLYQHLHACHSPCYECLNQCMTEI